MLNSHLQLAQLSQTYHVPEPDILLIALNVCGLKSDIPSSRARFKLQMARHSDDQFYFILPLRQHSVFELKDGRIWFCGDPIAEVEALEHDDAVLSYFRNGHKVLTLNSNARSQCVGCAFCYTVLQEESDPRLRLLDDLNTYLTLVKNMMGWSNLDSLDTLGVCTGCFHHEEKAIDHLSTMRNLLQSHSSTANIHFLSSVIRTRIGMERIQQEVGPFHLTITVECFSNRQLVLKQSKASLSYEAALDVLRAATEFGFKGDFTYIIGLDSLDIIRTKLPALVAEVTTFPRFQVFQPHNEFMETFATPEARSLEYYLKAREFIEELFRETQLRPRSWENYRPLWYFSFGDEQLAGTRI